MRRSRWLLIPFWATFVFLYVPILVLIVMSFNASSNVFSWDGFSFEWYGELVRNEDILEGFRNTLIVAVGSTLLATTLGTLLAVGLDKYSRSKALDAFTLAPAIIPDVVLAIGLLAFFALVQFTLGLHTVLLAHVVFNTAFVTAIVKARLNTWTIHWRKRLETWAQRVRLPLSASPAEPGPRDHCRRPPGLHS